MVIEPLILAQRQGAFLTIWQALHQPSWGCCVVSPNIPFWIAIFRFGLPKGS
jgi:hypothetical protein